MNTGVISDDELLLYHYRDGLDEAERARIAAALLAQPQLAHRLQTLLARLDAAAAMPDVPVPAPTQQRWHAALQRAATSEAARAPRPGLLPQWRWAAAAALVAVCLAGAFRLGMLAAPDRTDPMLAANPSRCECGLKWHLASVERQLAELPAASGEQRDALIEAVIAQNRIYAIAAERGGDQRLAGALRSFTLILERLARGGAGNATLAAEMAQLNFELRVMQARLTADTADAAAPGVAL